MYHASLMRNMVLDYDLQQSYHEMRVEAEKVHHVTDEEIIRWRDGDDVPPRKPYIPDNEMQRLFHSTNIRIIRDDRPNLHVPRCSQEDLEKWRAQLKIERAFDIIMEALKQGLPFSNLHPDTQRIPRYRDWYLEQEGLKQQKFEAELHELLKQNAQCEVSVCVPEETPFVSKASKKAASKTSGGKVVKPLLDTISEGDGKIIAGEADPEEEINSGANTYNNTANIEKEGVAKERQIPVEVQKYILDRFVTDHLITDPRPKNAIKRPQK